MRRAVIILGLLAIVVLAGSVWAVGQGHHHRVYRLFLLPIVAQRAAPGTYVPEALARRLNDFVYLNVRTPRDAAVLADTAPDILTRGFGYCDEAVWVFIHLLETRGQPARMTYLRWDNGVSPHTVAEVWLDGDWRVFDTSLGLIPRRPDGWLATTRDLASHPELLGPDQTHQAEWYRNAEVIATLDGSGPRTGVLGLLSRLGITRRRVVALTPAWLVDTLQDLYLLLPPPATTPRIFGDEPEASEEAERRLFFKARNYHILFRAAKAESAYKELLARYPDSRHRDHFRYHLGLLQLTQLKDPRSAILTFRKLVERYPRTPWRAEAKSLRALAHAALRR